MNASFLLGVGLLANSRRDSLLINLSIKDIDKSVNSRARQIFQVREADEL
jgi:hypothetical protein